jgi:membrane associated rhomboid family serine protease
MLDDRSYMRPSPYRTHWSVTTWLIVINLAIFLIQIAVDNLTGGKFTSLFALSVDGLKHYRIYQVLTFQFLHGGILHILFNMLTLFFFGRMVESLLGSREYLKLYLLSGSVGGLLEIGLGLAFPDRFGQGVAGASAGVCGVIAAMATRSPYERITLILYFIPVTMQARFLLLLEFVGVFVGIFGRPNGIANGAHLGGLLMGIVFVKWIANPYSTSSFDFLAPFRKLRRPKSAPAAPWASPKKKSVDVAPQEFMSQEVDPILDKISAQGIHSLTERERQILEAARKKMARR